MADHVWNTKDMGWILGEAGGHLEEPSWKALEEAAKKMKPIPPLFDRFPTVAEANEAKKKLDALVSMAAARKWLTRRVRRRPEKRKT